MTRATPPELPTDPLTVDRLLCFAVYSTAHAFNRFYRQELAGLGLTYPQYLVMVVLWDRHPLPVKAIGERLMLDSGTLTPLLKRMEAMNLIRRQRAEADERQVLISLTAEGEALRDKAQALPPAVACATGLGMEEIRALTTALTALRGHVLASLGPETDPTP